MKNILILGKPGSGKGTQGQLLAEELGYELVDAGSILRAEKASGSVLGAKIASIIDDGNLLPDKMIDKIIAKHIKGRKPSGFVFDGYPRTTAQAESLAKLINVDYVFLLDVDEDILVERILKRGETSGREDDQHEDIIIQRLGNYDNLTKPLTEYFKQQLIVIDGNRPINEIQDDINSFFISDSNTQISGSTGAGDGGARTGSSLGTSGFINRVYHSRTKFTTYNGIIIEKYYIGGELIEDKSRWILEF